MRITEKLRQKIRAEFARKGGKARAAKYDKATLTKWAKKGGRPKKAQKSPTVGDLQKDGGQ